MSENNKHLEEQEHAPNPTEGQAASSSSWKKMMSKKWVFPAMYMAAAAIILSLMWAYQDSGQNMVTEEDLGVDPIVVGQDPIDLPNQDAVAVTAKTETMQWPVADREALQVIMPFYEADASGEEKQAAMLEHDDMYIPSTGISLATEDNQAFEVLAAMSGTVTRVEKLPLLGNLVEITHEGGLKTIYQSLSDVTVSLDQDIVQGDVIAKAGRNELQKDAGIHVHFEIHQDNQPVNPEQFLIES
jgi:stage II sporulation protein Q